MGDAHEPPRLACFGDRIAGDAETLGLRCGENAFRSRELFYRRGVAVLVHVSIVSKYDTFATSLNVAWCCSGVFAFDRFVSSDDARKRSERDWGGSLDKARAVKVASARNTKPVSSYRFSETAGIAATAGRMRGGGNSASCSLCSPRHRYSWSVREFSLLFLTSRILRYNPQSCGCRQVVRPKLPNQFHARFFRKLTKQTITKNQFKGVLFDTPLFSIRSGNRRNARF